MPQGFETAEITPRSTTTGLSAGTESIVFLVTWDQSPLERFSTECRKTNTTVTVIFKKVMTFFNFEDMFRCYKHHRQLQNI